MDKSFEKWLEAQFIGQGFHQVWYQDIVKATGSAVLEDLTFKISESSD